MNGSPSLLDGRTGRSEGGLRGVTGNAINALLATAAMKFQKLLRTFALNFLYTWMCFCNQIQGLGAITRLPNYAQFPKITFSGSTN
jgi:hypothetical protein